MYNCPAAWKLLILQCSQKLNVKLSFLLFILFLMIVGLAGKIKKGPWPKRRYNFVKISLCRRRRKKLNVNILMLYVFSDLYIKWEKYIWTILIASLRRKILILTSNLELVLLMTDPCFSGYSYSLLCYASWFMVLAFLLDSQATQSNWYFWMILIWNIYHVLVLASNSSFRLETGLSSLNNAFCNEDQGITKLWELHHYDTTFSSLSLHIVSLENIEYPFLKPWLGKDKPIH